jgi:cell division protein FtsB
MKTARILLMIFLLISPFILHVWKKNMVNALNIKISNLTAEVQNLERNVAILFSKWRKETSYGIVEEKARKILNMKYPDKNEMFKIENFNFLR